MNGTGTTRAPSSGFTLIELLIVIAVILIILAGEAKVMRLLQRSASLARDKEAASSILASELAELKAKGLFQHSGSIPFPIPLGEQNDAPPGAQGEIRFVEREGGKLVEAQAILTWHSVVGKTELVLSTLLRAQKESKP
jgi:prepilin-type N-terminal cleavage/methylation domain-containing protein